MRIILAFTALLATDVALDPNTLIQYGVLGIMVAAMIFGLIWPKPAVEREKAARDKAEAQRDALYETLAEQVIPFLGDINDKVLPALNEVRDDVKEIKARLP